MKLYGMMIVMVLSVFIASTAVALDLNDAFDDAQRYFRRGDYSRALTEWTRILSPEPTDTNSEKIDISSVYFNRGVTYKRLLKWKEAADDFSMVIGLNPNDAEAYYQRGGCYNMMGLADKGAADIDRACEMKDDYCTEKMLEEKKLKNEKKTEIY